MLCYRQIKNYLKLFKEEEGQEQLLRDITNYITGFISNYCERSFELEERTDLLMGNGRAYLSVPLTPINEIKSLKIEGKEIEKGFGIKNRMIFYPELFPVRYTRYNENGQPNAYSRAYNIEITYTCGYEFPSWEAVVNETVQKELQYVALELLKHAYLNCRVEAELQQKVLSIGGESITRAYFKEGDKETKHLFAILRKYRKGVF